MTAAKKRVLIVEDDAQLREALVEKFSHAGLEPLQAADGEAGLAAALEEKPDIILLDIEMPKMDGITMLSHLRDDVRGRDMPVIVLTNVDDASKLLQAWGNRAMDFLVKSDWKIEDIVKKVRTRLETTTP
jgi:DNA-binding response OmpR family regulator